MNYAHKNLCETIDVAVQCGYAENQEARFPGDELGASATGLAYLKINRRRREPFAHRHRRAEEIFVVLSGTGRVKLDKELVDLSPRDAVRVGPGVTRALEAGDVGLAILVLGPHVENDVEIVDDFWGTR
jgi:mannose-6-phosphate isomerase-like protein (cupin superfamily)